MTATCVAASLPQQIRRVPDDLPRSSSGAGAARAMTAFFLVAVVLLVLANGFFVAAEFALVRSRRSRLEELAGRRGRRAAPGAAPAGRPQPVPVGLPVRHHAGLAGHRLPGRAGDRRARRAAVRRPLARRRRRRSRSPSPTSCHLAAHHARRAGPEDLRDRQGRGGRAADRAAAHLVQRARCARSSRALNRGLELASCARSASTRTPSSRRAAAPRSCAILIAQARTRRPARPGRGRDAPGRLPPPRAGGAAGHDADPGRGDGRPLRGRRDRAAPLRLLRPHAPGRRPRTRTADRVRGIVHANSLARQLMTEGPHASIEPLVKDAPIVPETKPLDDLLADLQRQRSSMAVVVDEYGRVAGIVTVEDIIEEVVGEIDDETDPAGGEVRRLANGDWFVRGHVALTDLTTTALAAAGRHRRLQLGRRLRLRRARAPAQARGHRPGRRLLDPRRVGAREPHRGGPHPRAPRAGGRRRRAGDGDRGG